MALACFLHVVMNSRLVSQESVISDPDDADEKAFDEKELEKALHEILYQDDDQDLQVCSPSHFLSLKGCCAGFLIVPASETRMIPVREESCPC